ncbi:MAG TPA: PAS domain-containing protein [Sedimentisphaerales bacterium]|nr:PAS domain-containing protein [Sedimentisphaerales bacterium]
MDLTIDACKRLEHTLRHLAAIAEQATEGIAVVDLDGNLQFANMAWTQMHGYSTTDGLAGRHIRVFHTEEQMKTEVIPFLEETERRGQLKGMLEHVRKDGTPFPACVKAVVVRDEAGKATGLVIFATDITQHRQLEDKLRENAERAENLSEQMNQLQNLFGECQRALQSLQKQTAGLEAGHAKLPRRIAELDQSQGEGQEDTGQRAESTVENERFPHKDREHERPEKVSVRDSERVSKTARQAGPLNTDELRKVAELGRRLGAVPR